MAPKKTSIDTVARKFSAAYVSGTNNGSRIVKIPAAIRSGMENRRLTSRGCSSEASPRTAFRSVAPPNPADISHRDDSENTSRLSGVAEVEAKLCATGTELGDGSLKNSMHCSSPAAPTMINPTKGTWSEPQERP